ncbi:MAG: energy transducer TonB [bacterium]|nr:energy transducer TonB [bacterium]
MTTSFMLFWIMQSLVSVEVGLPPKTKTLVVEFVRLIVDTPPIETEPPTPPRPRPQPQPALPPIVPTAILDPAGFRPEAFDPTNSEKIVPDTHATALATGDAVPLVRVEPTYPPRAQRAGIEGHVDLRFDITAAGTVEDVEVIAAKPPGVFDREAIRAVRKWRYNPTLQANPGVRFEDQAVRLEFELPREGLQ